MIDWSKQHCGVIKSEYRDLLNLMPDLKGLISTFPEDPNDFIWDVKVHMLMPGQYPCIPNWHFDNVPRNENGVQDFTKIRKDLPMYLWVSNDPVTEFRKDGKNWYIKEKSWIKFTQEDEHRGTISKNFCWRGFIRATHRGLGYKPIENPIRRHSQVYLDSNNFKW